MQLLLQCMSPFLALNGHAYCVPSCPLLRAQLPRRYVVGAAVIDPKPTFVVPILLRRTAPLTMW
jgi:hypothetical protein